MNCCTFMFNLMSVAFGDKCMVVTNMLLLHRPGCCCHTVDAISLRWLTLATTIASFTADRNCPR